MRNNVALKGKALPDCIFNSNLSKRTQLLCSSGHFHHVIYVLVSCLYGPQDCVISLCYCSLFIIRCRDILVFCVSVKLIPTDQREGGRGREWGTETVNKHSDTQSRRGSRALRFNYGCLIEGKTQRDTERGLTEADCRWMCESAAGLKWICTGPGVNGITPVVPVLLLEETCGCRASRSPRFSSSATSCCRRCC